jgi:two-component system chemotaxis response regulator CheY
LDTLTLSLAFTQKKNSQPKRLGVTALKKILEFDKKAVVIMISALGKNDLLKKSLLAGAKNYIVKPLNREKVLERIVLALTQL